jgi:hypothetical protein
MLWYVLERRKILKVSEIIYPSWISHVWAKKIKPVIWARASYTRLYSPFSCTVSRWWMKPVGQVVPSCNVATAYTLILPFPDPWLGANICVFLNPHTGPRSLWRVKNRLRKINEKKQVLVFVHGNKRFNVPSIYIYIQHLRVYTILVALTARTRIGPSIYLLLILSSQYNQFFLPIAWLKFILLLPLPPF